jgi:phytoene dehydrogenase-like protein
MPHENHSTAEFDGIVIGAGHNGLVLANYLVRSGLRVLLLERRLQPGGGLSTSDRLTRPGFLHNLHSINHFAITSSPWWRDLQLSERVSYINPEVEFAQPHRDGSALIIAPDLDATLTSFRRLSPADAATFAELNPKAELWEQHILLPERYCEPLPDNQRRALWGSSALGAEFIAHTDRMPLEIVKSYFDNDHIRVLLLFKLSIFGTINFETVYHRSPAGTFARALGVRNTYQLCQGGSWNLARGLMERYLVAGGEYRNLASVARITIQGGRAAGVELASGERIRSKFVASTLGPHQTFFDWIGQSQLPDALGARVGRFAYTSWGLWGAHWAFKQPPRYLAEVNEPLIGRAQKYHLGEETMDEVDAQHDALAGGTFLRKPQFGGGALSVLDPSQAPAGLHTAYAWQPVPRLEPGKLAEIEAEREEHARRTLATWSEYAPNMTPDNVLAMATYTPSDYVQELPNMIGGDIFMGAFSGGQVMDNHFGYCSEIPNLYMAGSSVHPGGAISGGPGYIAAGVIVEALGATRWWPKIDLEQHAAALRNADIAAPVGVSS